MTSRSVTALPLARNDLLSLKQAYQVALTHFKECDSFSEHKYLENLKIIVGSYVLTLIETNKIAIPDPLFNAYCTHHSALGHQTDAIDGVAMAIAEMLNFTTDKLYTLKQPWFYEPFVLSVKETLGGKISRIFWDEAKAMKLINVLLPKC